MKTLPFILMLISFSAVTVEAYANCLVDRLTGVNVAGAEFNTKRLPGNVFQDYTYPNENELAYIAAQGATVIRLPFRWERLQPEAFGEFSAQELNLIKKTVASANALGLCVILDVHNYGKFYSQSIEKGSTLAKAFVNLWLRLAKEFDDPEATAFGLMNEPAHMLLADWEILAKATLVSLRKAQANNLILVSGGHWSGVHDWFVEHGGRSNADAFAELEDPLNRMVLEVHQYADRYYSGTEINCQEADHFTLMFERISQWAQSNQQRLFLGEFGTPDDAVCLNTLEHMISQTSHPVWRGWTYWAAGGWWGNYPLAINTGEEPPSPKWQILKAHF